MNKTKNILAVVPARGGSKGIPLKNLRTISGTPMVGLVGKLIQEVPLITRAVLSTDHPQIAETGKQYGLETPFSRPDTLSGDRIGDIDVLTHALHATENDDNIHYDIIVMLQPTSPLRTAKHVTNTIEHLITKKLDSTWTISQTDSKSHPLKQLTMKEGKLGYYDNKGKEIIARQQLEPVYHRNGIAYAITRECLLEQKTLMGKKSGAILLEDNLVSIDTEWDIELTEFLISNNNKKCSH